MTESHDNPSSLLLQGFFFSGKKKEYAKIDKKPDKSYNLAVLAPVAQ